MSIYKDAKVFDILRLRLFVEDPAWFYLYNSVYFDTCHPHKMGHTDFTDEDAIKTHQPRVMQWILGLHRKTEDDVKVYDV
jgi:hypothetical protein